jgi:hypothetical protein
MTLLGAAHELLARNVLALHPGSANVVILLYTVLIKCTKLQSDKRHHHALIILLVH